MKYLKIENNKAYYFKAASSGFTSIEIDKINKDDLLELLNAAVGQEFEMDEYSEALLGNKAHQIIYKHLHEKFANLLLMKDKFKDESESLYRDALEKYGSREVTGTE